MFDQWKKTYEKILIYNLNVCVIPTVLRIYLSIFKCMPTSRNEQIESLQECRQDEYKTVLPPDNSHAKRFALHGASCDVEFPSC